MSRRLAVVALSALAGAGCSLLAGLEDLSGGKDEGVGGIEGGSGSSGQLADGAVVPGSADGEGPGSAPGSAVEITTAGAGERASGLGFQSHLAWAAADQTWVLAFFDGASELRTRTSKDFATWTPGASIALPFAHKSEGRNLSVATTPVGAKDALHVALSLSAGGSDRRHYWLRGLVAGENVTFGTAVEVARVTVVDADLDPDGCNVAVGVDGVVTLLSSWSTGTPTDSTGTGNPYLFRSSAADRSETFTPTWAKTVVESVNTLVNAHAAVPLDGSRLLAVHEDAETEPDPKNLRWSVASSGSATGAQDVFTSSGAFDAADWSLLRASASDVHAVRLRRGGGFDHRRFDGGAWRSGGTVPAESLEPGRGLVLVRSGGSVSLLGIAQGTNALRRTTWDGTSWSAWSTLVPGGGALRSGLSASTGEGRSAVVWTEPRAAGGVAIMGALL